MPTSQNRDMGHPAPGFVAWPRGGADSGGCYLRWLFGFVLFEELAGFFEVEGVSVDDQLVVAGVVRNGEDAFDLMAVLAEDLDDEIDVNHAWKSNSRASSVRIGLLHGILSGRKIAADLGLA